MSDFSIGDWVMYYDGTSGVVTDIDIPWLGSSETGRVMELTVETRDGKMILSNADNFILDDIVDTKLWKVLE